MKLIKLMMVPGLVATALSFAACERLEPQPEPSVVLQAKGHFAAAAAASGKPGQEREATFIMESTPLGLAFEVRDAASQGRLARGAISGMSMKDLMDEIRGPIISQFSSTTLHAAQQGKTEKTAQNVSSEAIPEAVQGVFQFEGLRHVEYNTGIITHWTDGNVHFILKDLDGKNVGGFDGLSVKDFQRKAVGTATPGVQSGAHELGAGLLGTNTAVAEVALPAGAGKILSDGDTFTFRFNKNTEITPIADDGLGELGLLTSGPNYIEISDHFHGRIALHDFKVDRDQGDHSSPAEGKGEIRFNLTLSIGHSHILVVGTNSVDASLIAADGQKAEFHGSIPSIQTELDW